VRGGLSALEDGEFSVFVVLGADSRFGLLDVFSASFGWKSRDRIGLMNSGFWEIENFPKTGTREKIRRNE
jgi:hypothetical protein